MMIDMDRTVLDNEFVNTLINEINSLDNNNETLKRLIKELELLKGNYWDVVKNSNLKQDLILELLRKFYNKTDYWIYSKSEPVPLHIPKDLEAYVQDNCLVFEDNGVTIIDLDDITCIKPFPADRQENVIKRL